MTNDHLISCICISTNRVDKLRNTISYFMAQTHEHKELLIVSAVYDSEYEAVIRVFNEPAIKYFANSITQGLTLGGLRNYAVERAGGNYICVWDDDDWYHNKRLEIQLQQTLHSCKRGTILPYYIVFDQVNKEAYMSFPIPPPATLLCEASLLRETNSYRNQNKGEDAFILNSLFQKNTLFPLVNPALYIYVFHGQNTWDWQHIKKFCCGKFTPKVSLLISDIVLNKYPHETASQLLNSEIVSREFDYFHSYI